MTEAELIREFNKRAKAASLKVDCLGAGNIDAEIAVIGEAPGPAESQQNMPMIGSSGRYLWKVLQQFNIRRTQCWVTNVAKRENTVSTNMTNDKSPFKKQELEHWEGLLDWELDQLPNLKYVVILGNIALKAILNESGISQWRGSVVDAVVGRQRRRVRAFINYNPAAVLRRTELEPIYKMDFQKLDMVIRGTFTPHKVKYHINPTFDEAMSWIEMFEANHKKPLAFDIEVMSNETACYGFSQSPYEGYCINLRNERENRFTLEEDRQLYKKIQGLLASPRTKLICQSGNFDAHFVGYKDRMYVHRIWFDTLLAHHTLYPRMPHNLGFLTSQYTTHPYYKDEGKSWREGGNINQFWEYNCKDTAITYAVHEKLLKELQQQKLDDFFFNHVMQVLPELVRMTVGGIRADITLKDEISKQLDQDLELLYKQFQEAVQESTGDPDLIVNPKSAKQLSELFYTRLGLIGRGTSTNADNRKRMRDHPRTSPSAVKMLNILDKYKAEHKFHSVYATMQVDPDRRIRCEYKQFGTQSAPGRLSSAGTMWGSGTNLQNQPERAHPMFIADDGYMFTYFDLSQAEARIVAYKWKVNALIDNFEKQASEGLDVHRLNAARIFQKDYDEIPTKDRDSDFRPTERFLGKRCVHGLNYTMQAPKLAEVCNIPLEQANEAYYRYHQAFPEIQKAWMDIRKTVTTERMLFNCFGRRMIFMERLTDESMESIIAFDPQSTIGDKVCQVIYQCHQDSRWPSEARIVLNIHDALIAIHPHEDKDIVTEVMRDHAESPILIRGEQVSIPTDFKHSVADDKGIHRWSTLQ